MKNSQVNKGRLLLLVVLLFSSMSPFDTSHAFAAPGEDNPIVIENRQPGSKDWKLPRPGFKAGDDIEKQIKGYASHTSVNKGSPITFFISVNPAQTYTIEVYRMGWYEGLGGRLLQHIGPLDGVQQSECPTDATTGMISCEWDPSYTFRVPDTWTSGIYLAVLSNSEKYQNYIIFVVRDDQRVADLLYQQPVTTYQAYNNYPDDEITGKSLYNHNSSGENTIAGDARAVQVSFDRPYKNRGAGDFLGVEVHFVRWMERSGYDVAYSTNIDTHARGRNLLNYKGFLSVGHDEYWSKQMYDAAEKARDKGVNLAFFGANDIYWQVRFASAPDGRANRIMICYKDAALDPTVNRTLKTVKWRDQPVNRPEQSLIGIQYTANLKGNMTFAATIVNSSNWIYAGTGFSDGNATTAIFGDEVDRFMSEYPPPPHKSQTLLSEAEIINTSDEVDHANSSIYQAESGAWVFAAGSITWSVGLDKEGVVDSRLQQMAANILNRFVASPPRSSWEYVECVRILRPRHGALSNDCQP